jgi:AraC family transcriptional regulator
MMRAADARPVAAIEARGAAPQLPAGRFHGQPKFVRQSGPFRLTEAACASGMVVPAHAHERDLIVLVLSGRYVEACSGSEPQARRPMSLVYLPAGLPHSERHEAAGRRLIAEIPPAIVERIERMGVDRGHPYDLTGTPAVGIARSLYGELCNPDAASSLAIEARILEIFVLIRRRDGPRTLHVPRYVRQAHAILRSRFAERLNVGALAREIGVDACHLMKAFRRWTGHTIADRIRMHRLDYACREIVRDDVSLFDVAIAAGFYDQSHFCRAFRKHTGMTPGQYRRHARSRARDPASS